MIVQSEPVINLIASGAPLQLTMPDPCDPIAICVDVAPPLDTGEDSPVDVHRSPITSDPPEPPAVATAPDCPPLPPELSTGIDDQKISPIEGLAQDFTAMTLVIADRLPGQPVEPPKTPRAFADEDRECYYVTTATGPQITNVTWPSPLNTKHHGMPSASQRRRLLPRR